MEVAKSLLDKMVPSDLLRNYKTYIKTGGARGEQRPRGDPRPLAAMLESIRVTTRGAKRTNRKPTTSCFLIPKNEEKCRFIMDPILNAVDTRRPRSFRLPTLEGLGRRLA